MQQRRFGRIGIGVSALSFGTGTLRHADPREAADAIACALDLGINAFEVDAGDDASVALLGAGLARAQGRAHVFARAASQVAFDLPSPHVRADQAWPGAALRAQVEGLLARLGVDRLALLQLHAWCPEWLHEGDWRDTLVALRREGKIAGFGVSLFDHDVDAGLEAVAGGAIDAVQVMVNILDPSAAETVLPLCQRHDVGVIARAPLYFGAFARHLDFAPDDWRHGYFYPAHRAETAARVKALAADIGPPLVPALRFALAQPGVSTVAVGMRSRAQVEANVAAVAAGPLDDAACAALGRHKWLC